MLLIVDGGQFVRFVANVICEDFVWFTLIFHLSIHSCRRSRCCWSFCDANASSLSIARRAVSSAIVVRVEEKLYLGVREKKCFNTPVLESRSSEFVG
jgi:hypothetical protein